MTKRLTALGFTIVAVVWGPYVYAELARKPLAPAADEPSEPIAVAPVAYEAPLQTHAQLIAALEAQRQKLEPAAIEPAAVEPAEPAVEPAAPPPTAANAETAIAPATDPAAAQPPTLPIPGQLSPDHPASAVQQAQPVAANEPAQPSAAAEPEPPAKAEAPAEEPAHAAKEPEAEHAEAKHAEKKPADEAASTDGLAPAFRSAFDREARDASWANGEEPRLTQLLAGAGVPPSAIGEVRCQSTVCRVALPSIDVSSAQQSPLYQLLTQRVRDEFGTLSLDSAGGDGEQHAALYVLRKGAELSRETN